MTKGESMPYETWDDPFDDYRKGYEHRYEDHYEYYYEQTGDECSENCYENTVQSMYNITDFNNMHDNPPSNMVDVTQEFKKYITGYFNGTDSRSHSVKRLIERINNRFEGASLQFFLDAKKISKASTFEDNPKSFKIWKSEFSKHHMREFFECGVDIETMSEFWDVLDKVSSERFYFGTGKRINMYYFRVYKNKNKSYNKDKEYEEIKQKVEERETSYSDRLEKSNKKSTGGFMNLGKTMATTMEMNKEAAKHAALIKVGNTANETVVDILTKNAIPKKYQKFARSPFFKLVVANVAAVSMKQLIPQKSNKIDAVADAMVLASMIDITNMIDINSIIKQVMESVDISSLTGDNEEK